MKPSRAFESTPKQLLATVASLMHEEGKVVPQSGGVLRQQRSPSDIHETPKENTVRRLRGDGGASARSVHPRARPSRTQASLLEINIRHIYLVAVLWSLRQYSRGLVAGGNLRAHGLHYKNNQGAKGIFRVRVEEL